jgi:drug/metabolite transporter (DMT)-like permease
MWVVFAFGSALMETCKDVLGKTGTTRTNEYATAFWMKFFGLLMLAPVVLIFGIPPLYSNYWLALFLGMFTISSGTILYMRAVKLSPLSVSIPMLSFNPIFTALLAYALYKQVPDALGWTGILLVSAGLYMMRLARKDLWRGLLRPILSIKEEPGAIAMLGVAIIWSVGAYVAKMLVVSSSALMGAFGLAVAGSAGLFVLGTLSRKLSIREAKSHFRLFVPMGVADGLSELFIMSALTGGIVPYVIPIKRTNIALSSLAGSVFFGERLGKAKLVGMAMVLLGIFLIIAL